MDSVAEFLRNPLFTLVTAAVVTALAMYIESKYFSKKEIPQNVYIKNCLLVGAIASVIVYITRVTSSSSGDYDLLDEPF